MKKNLTVLATKYEDICNGTVRCMGVSCYEDDCIYAVEAGGCEKGNSLRQDLDPKIRATNILKMLEYADVQGDIDEQT